MKITFITDTLSSGGSERVISVLANELSKQYNVEIICLRTHSSYYQISQKVKITYAVDYCGDSLVKKFFWLKNYISKESIVIAFMVPVYIFTLASLMFSKNTIVVSERNDPSAASPFRKLLRMLLIWRAQGIVVQTASIAKKMPFWIRKRQTIIYNPISDNFKSGSALLSDKEDLIVSVGRLSPQKNQKMMIDAFGDLLSTKPQYRLEIYGEGESRGELENYIKKLNLGNKVFLKGRSNNLQHLLNQSKLFVLTSDYEGMSNAMMEALYIGLPVVTTAVSGTEELITDGLNGYTVPIGATKEFANSMVTILSNEKKRHEMANNAVSIKDKIEISAIVNKWVELLNKFHKYE